LEVTIKVLSVSEGDPYPRFHGMAINSHLDAQFWNTQPANKIGVAGKTFSYQKVVNLSSGRHTVEYGVSTWVGKWNAEIYVNDSLIVKSEVTVENIGNNQYPSGTFLIGPMGEKVIPLKIPVIGIGGNIISKFPPIFKMSKIRSFTGGILSRVRRK